MTLRQDTTTRCDRCGAAPMQQWSHKDGRDLLFCNAHNREHQEGLRKAGFVLVWDVRLDTEEVAGERA